MKKHTPDDSSVVIPAPSLGETFVSQLEERAAAIYPDHSTSRQNYIREKMVAEITRLCEDYKELKFRMDGLEK